MQSIWLQVSNSLGKFLLYTVVFLALSGGFIFEGKNFRFEISQLNIFGVLLCLILLLRHTLANRSDPNSVENKLDRLIEWGQLNERKKLLIGTLLVAVLGFFVQTLRHYTFESAFYDMTCVHPALFYPFDPGFFHCSVCRNETQFAEHLIWSLIPFSLIFQIFKSDLLIIAFKYVCIFVPVYYFIKNGPLREYSKRYFWALIFLMLSSPLKANFAWDFREDHFAFGLILLSYLSLYHGKFWFSFALIVLTALTKENLPLSTLFMFVPILWAKEIPLAKNKRYILAALVTVFSIAYTILAFKVLIPHFMTGIEEKNNILLRFPGMGSTMGEFFSNLIFHPIDFITLFLSRLSLADTAKYLTFVLLPFIMGYRSWLWTVPAWPQLAANILVDHPTQRMMVHHYEAVIIPFFFAALCFSLAKKDFTKERMKWGLLLALCVGGRGPLVEITKRLYYKGHLIPAAIEMNSWNDIEGPLAADAFTLTHFHKVLDLRVLETPQRMLPDTEEERLRYFIKQNPKRTIHDQARDGSDAKSFIVNLTLLGGPWLAEELRKQGAQEVRRAKDLYGNDMAILFKVTRNPFDVICERDGICQEQFKQ